ncbi:MAG: hypothetical protein ACI36Y_09100 [Coriobacteriales bacterium]
MDRDEAGVEMGLRGQTGGSLGGRIVETRRKKKPEAKKPQKGRAKWRKMTAAERERYGLPPPGNSKEGPK